ncbi:MAG: hypothetical protein WAU01_14650 [Saprospiraceae bacterium]
MDIPDEIKKYEAQYAHLRAIDPTRSVSPRSRYMDQWQPSTMAGAGQPEIIKTPLTYEVARMALWIIVRQSLTKECKQFYIHSGNKEKLSHIIRAMIGDIDETSRYDPTKGIYLYGSYSSGKTWIMRQIITMIQTASLTMMYDNVSANIMSISYKTDIMMRARKEKSIAFLDDIFRNKDIIYIDDIGYEDDSQLVLWGNRENIIVHLIDILHKRYLQGARIHFTSNLQPKHPSASKNCIYKIYGQGTYDRLIEMTTPILWERDLNLRTGQHDSPFTPLNTNH